MLPLDISSARERESQTKRGTETSLQACPASLAFSDKPNKYVCQSQQVNSLYVIPCCSATINTQRIFQLFIVRETESKK